MRRRLNDECRLVEFSETLFMTYVNYQKAKPVQWFLLIVIMKNWVPEILDYPAQFSSHCDATSILPEVVDVTNILEVGTVQYALEVSCQFDKFWKQDKSQGHVKTNIITAFYLRYCTSPATVTRQDSTLVPLVLSFEDNYCTCRDTKPWLLRWDCEQRPYLHVDHDLPVALGHPLEWEINI